MPAYVLGCLGCETVKEELLGISELEGRDPEKLNLSDLKVNCKKCGKSVFRKLVTAHGKTAHNWSAWQREP
jgi:hypothetical protein